MLSDRMTAVTLTSAEYNIYSTLQLENELAALVPGNNVVDCRNVAYVDSTALSVFVRVFKRLRAREPETKIALVNTAPTVRRVFEVTRLDGIFRLG